ncbi:MAG: hypothetical protein AAGG59_01495, partial [Bacteroidota bacterium]
MNKQRFRQVVGNYSGLSAQDRIDLHDLVKDHPYSQILHTLVAKANHDAKTDIVKQSLNYAAMYASDRSVLKDIIQSGPDVKVQAEVKRKKNPPEAGNRKGEVSQPEEESENDIVSVKKGKVVTVNTNELFHSSDDLIKEVWEDLAALKKSKANYMAQALSSVEKPPEKITPVRKASSRSATTHTKPGTAAKSKSVSTRASTAKSISKKKQTPAKTDSKTTKAKTSSTVAKSESTANKSAAKKDTTNKTPEVTGTSTRKKSSKTAAKQSDKKTAPAKKKVLTERLSPESQSEIIERFIDKEPRISAKTIKATEADQTDLSEKSTVYSEDLISENLAQILLAQGKKDKAIDIYKKLIWKFPQKKSYFA